MLKPSVRWIGDASHIGALAVHLHLHRPHQLCHPAIHSHHGSHQSSIDFPVSPALLHLSHFLLSWRSHHLFHHCLHHRLLLVRRRPHHLRHQLISYLLSLRTLKEIQRHLFQLPALQHLHGHHLHLLLQLPAGQHLLKLLLCHLHGHLVHHITCSRVGLPIQQVGKQLPALGRVTASSKAGKSLCYQGVDHCLEDGVPESAEKATTSPSVQRPLKALDECPVIESVLDPCENPHQLLFPLPLHHLLHGQAPPE